MNLITPSIDFFLYTKFYICFLSNPRHQLGVHPLTLKPYWILTVRFQKSYPPKHAQVVKSASHRDFPKEIQHRILQKHASYVLGVASAFVTVTTSSGGP